MAALTLPGIVWLCVFFIAPLYVVLAILFGGVDPILRQPIPVWNPLDWDFSQFNYVMGRIFGHDAYFRPALIRTVVYVGDRELPVPDHRLPGRLLHRPVLRSLEGSCCWPP